MIQREGLLLGLISERDRSGVTRRRCFGGEVKAGTAVIVQKLKIVPVSVSVIVNWSVSVKVAAEKTKNKFGSISRMTPPPDRERDLQPMRLPWQPMESVNLHVPS